MSGIDFSQQMGGSLRLALARQVNEALHQEGWISPDVYRRMKERLDQAAQEEPRDETSL